MRSKPKPSKPEPYIAIPIKVLLNPKITDGALRLYGLIKQQAYFNDKEHTRISNNEIMRKLKMKHDTIRRRLKNLTAEGLIEVELKKSSHQGRCSTSRIITII